MTRTTVDIDSSVLDELKRRQRAQGKSLGALISELLASALAAGADHPAPAFEWIAQSMEAQVDLEDKEAVQALLDRS